MNTTNLLYTIAQVAHNFGAAAVIGGSFFASWSKSQMLIERKKLAWMVMIGWMVQGLSGAGFGTISYLAHGRFPEIQGAAKVALFIKILCTFIGFTLSFLYIYKKDAWREMYHSLIWRWIFILASAALFSAAILRWFS